jgi:hypothetical protein
MRRAIGDYPWMTGESTARHTSTVEISTATASMTCSIIALIDHVFAGGPGACNPCQT